MSTRFYATKVFVFFIEDANYKLLYITVKVESSCIVYYLHKYIYKRIRLRAICEVILFSRYFCHLVLLSAAFNSECSV